MLQVSEALLLFFFLDETGNPKQLFLGSCAYRNESVQCVDLLRCS